MRISLIVPTLNAGKQIDILLERILAQTRVPDEILVVDSQSDDDTVRRVQKYPEVQMIRISRRDFDHGGTRDMALRRTTGDIILFMTQDAVPADEYYIERLLSVFSATDVAAVGGRQIAKPDAPRWEQLVREYNYPAQTRIWDQAQISRMGVRAFMISDACSAYRRDAYLKVGGFDRPVMTNEDMLMAQKLLEAGYEIGYCGDAAVLHSHRMNLYQQYCRNYAVGRMLKRYEARFCSVTELGEGTRVAVAVLRKLREEGEFVQSIAFCMDCAARLLGNRIGRWMEKLAR